MADVCSISSRSDEANWVIMLRLRWSLRLWLQPRLEWSSSLHPETMTQAMADKLQPTWMFRPPVRTSLDVVEQNSNESNRLELGSWPVSWHRDWWRLLNHIPVQSFQKGAPPAPPAAPGKGRMVPDVSADADPNTGYIIWVQFGPEIMTSTLAKGVISLI